MRRFKIIICDFNELNTFGFDFDFDYDIDFELDNFDKSQNIMRHNNLSSPQ